MYRSVALWTSSTFGANRFCVAMPIHQDAGMAAMLISGTLCLYIMHRAAYGEWEKALPYAHRTD